MAKSVVKVSKGKAICRILNSTDETLHLSSGQVVAKASNLLNEQIVKLDEPEPCVIQNLNASPDHNSTNHLTQNEAIQIAKQLGIDLNNPALTPDHKAKLFELIGRNRDVFAINLAELGRTTVHTHRIITGDAMPVRQRAYRYSPKVEK